MIWPWWSLITTIIFFHDQVIVLTISSLVYFAEKDGVKKWTFLESFWSKMILMTCGKINLQSLKDAQAGVNFGLKKFGLTKASTWKNFGSIKLGDGGDILGDGGDLFAHGSDLIGDLLGHGGDLVGDGDHHNVTSSMATMSDTLSTSISATMSTSISATLSTSLLTTMSTFICVGHHVSHHNDILTLKGSETLTEWKSESETNGQTDVPG